MSGSPKFPSKLDVEGIQSIVPTKPTDPRQSCKIHVPQDLGSAALLQRRFHLLLGYTKGYDEDSGWLVAGLIKESLGRALMEQPLLAGRLRRCQHSDTELEIVTNDSGARLVEARADMSFHDFVDMMKKVNTKEAQTHLVFWEDILHTNPHFSPLFYVQVTNFSCGGYSIGISCSLLLMDPFVLSNFLKKWSDIHKNIVSNVTKSPIFYLPSYGKPSSSPALLMGSNTFNNAAQTVFFKIPTKVLSSNTNIQKDFAAQCINEAEHDVGRKLPSNLSLFLKLSNEDAKVEICSREGLLESESSEYNINGLSCSRTWNNELGLESVCFNEGKKPVYVSCWINSVVDEGSVMVVPIDANSSGFQIVVTFT